MRSKYKILHTEAKYAIDGKDHYRVMKSMGRTGPLGSELWVSATDKSHSTLEQAEKSLSKLMQMKGGTM